MGEKGDKTNLASEFYVLSMLHLKGYDAYLTLANKKSVDIIMTKGKKIILIEVKGTKSNNFPVKQDFPQSKNLVYVFVSFNKNNDPTIAPEVYVVPSLDLKLPQRKLEGKSLFYAHKTWPDIEINRLRKMKGKYLNAWSILDKL